MSVINFMNRHHGVMNFFALSGPLIGRMITVRYLNRDWHLQNRAELFGHLTDAQFDSDILGSIGIVHASGQPVPAGIVCRIEAELAYERRSITRVVSNLCTGVSDAMGNWRRLTLLEQDSLFPTEDPSEALEDLRVEALPASALPAVTNSMSH